MTEYASTIVLDTNVLSEFLRPKPDPHVAVWTIIQIQADLHLTATSEAELLYGASILPAGNRRTGLLDRIGYLIEKRFGKRVLPFDEAAARAFADIASSRRAMGRPIQKFDCQIAAIARSRRTAVATRNEKDFRDCGIVVINPWKAGAELRRMSTVIHQDTFGWS